MRTAPRWLLPLLVACGGAAQIDKDEVDSDPSDSDDTVDTDDTPDTDDTLPDGPNTPPGAPEVAITPGGPNTLDDLVTTFVFAATDPDGDALTYRYAWLVDGAPRAGLTTATVPSAETARGQVWEVRVRAFDGRAEGPTATATTTILNAPPTVAVAFTIPSPTTDDDLVVDGTIDDPDGDTLVQTWTWTKNGLATAQRTNTVPASATSNGDVWQARVVVTDGQGGSTEQTLSVTIANRAPTISNLRITPNPASPSRNLRAEFTAEDPDGDTLTVSYAWTKNGVLTGVVTSVVPSAQTAEGDLWGVTVTVDDRKGGTAQAQASLTVANTPPVLASVAITPDPPGDNDNLVARVAVSDPDGDALQLTYTWYRDGSVFRTGSGNTIANSSTLIGQVWEVSATVSDGTASDGPLLSQAVTITDRPPTDPTIRLDPATPIPCDDLVCRVVEPSFDPDGTGVTLTLRWKKNGVAWSGGTLTTFRAGDTIAKANLSAGDTWSCEAQATSGALSSALVTATGTVPASQLVEESFDIQARARADVLLVVDDSCSMTEEQSLLATAAEAFLDELGTTGVDYHVGVVTTDMVAPARSGQLVLADGLRYVTPGSADPYGTLSTMIQVGTAGSADERGLAAMQAALSSPLVSTTNAGFLRADGGLGVLFLSDEPDFSPNSVASYVSFLASLRADPADLVTRGIVGPPSGCASATGGGRYIDFVDATGGGWSSICAPGFGLALAEMAGAVAGLPRVLPLQGFPEPGTLVVEIDLPGGGTVTGVQGQDWIYDAQGNQVVLLQRPVSGSVVRVSFTAVCPTDVGPGDTDADTGLFADSDTDSGLTWPWGTGLPPLPAIQTLREEVLDTATLNLGTDGPPSTASLWGPSSFP